MLWGKKGGDEFRQSDADTAGNSKFRPVLAKSTRAGPQRSKTSFLDSVRGSELKDSAASISNAEDVDADGVADADIAPNVGAQEDKGAAMLRSFQAYDTSITVECNAMCASPDGHMIAGAYTNGSNSLVVYAPYKKSSGPKNKPPERDPRVLVTFNDAEHAAELQRIEDEKKGVVADDGVAKAKPVASDAERGRVVAWSPDGRFLVLGGKGKTEMVEQMKEERTLDASGNEVVKQVPTTVKRQRSSLLVFDMRQVSGVAPAVTEETKKHTTPLIDLSEEGYSIKSLAFSTDGKYLTVSTSSKKVYIYATSVPTGSKLQSKWVPGTTSVKEVLFSRYEPHIFPLEKKGEEATVPSHQIRAVSWDNKSEKLAVACSSKTESATVFVLDMTGEKKPVNTFKS
ncbi:hypothetical protein TeGR_g13460 [Tetraparma gracilis]|uniref:Uncharacterized protein n=1 Tax=Tetraparma gracilis TaxID=2962635 RepID=A0ABQ6MAV3_9STRA|nr:hypothetical protein TeGR_g13460 [Tetraparma gracilis]